MPEQVVAALRAAGCVYAEDEAALLCGAATGEALVALVARRTAGEPLEQVLGWAGFCGSRVVVEPGVFVPRRRTEHLVALAVGLGPRVAVDLCCGSGAVGVALLAALPGLELHAADLDPVAVRCARRNLPAAEVHEGDLYAALPGGVAGRVDVLAVNAPYVPSAEVELMPPEARLHEPLPALDGGVDGLDLQRRVVGEASAWLRPGGHLLLETSTRQAGRTAGLVDRAGLEAQVSRCDELDATVVLGRRVG